jgi:hypothetical protein
MADMTDAYLGEFTRGDMVPEFSDAVFEADVQLDAPGVQPDSLARERRRARNLAHAHEVNVKHARAFQVRFHERTVGKHLRALGLRRLVPRPQHPKADPEAQEAFKKTSLRP